MKEKILFIVNPISGTGKQKGIEKLLKENLDLNRFLFEVELTEYRGHATIIAEENREKYDCIVAVGGDGTVNEVAKGLVNSNCVMGILPVGSGNGLARHLKLSMRLVDSIKVLNKLEIQTIDTATINGECFVNVAGIGFDAHVAHLYAKESKRGPIPYAKLMAFEFQKYKPVEYKVSIEGESYNLSAFLISFANSSQFGNNAYISPHAIINDGLIDVCMMSNFPLVEAGQLALKLFNKRMDKSRYMRIERGAEVKIKAESEIIGHIDGEPVNFSNEISVVVNPSSLKMVYNKQNPGLLAKSPRDLLNVNLNNVITEVLERNLKVQE